MMLLGQRLIFWACMPFVIPQALLLRRRAPRFAGAKGPSSGTFGEGRQLKLLGVGDSIIAGVGASTLEKALIGQTAAALAKKTETQISWQAAGMSGAKTEKVRTRVLGRVKTDGFDVVVVTTGVNDVTALRRTKEWNRDLKKLIRDIKNRFPDAIIAFTGLPPLRGFPLLPSPLRHVIGLRARIFDTYLEQIIIGEENTVYVPLHFDPKPDMFSPDGYHPSEESYTALGDAVAEHLAPFIQ